MKLIAQLKLTPDAPQVTLLLATLERANAVCNEIRREAWENGIFSKYRLQERTYHSTRDQFGLSAQLTIRCLAKVADAYTYDRDTLRTFKRYGALAYDDRILKKNSGRQRRFQANETHRIAKQLVAKAKDTQRALALEELTGIRTRTTVRKWQRAPHGNWAFRQLRTFIVYKARRAGVLVEVVDPRNTSRICSRCGYSDKANRTSQARFCCLQCGYTTHADLNAARNIRERAAVNRPMAPGLRA
jgi:IS605 OrfB family transposase